MDQPVAFYRSSIGKKVVMALSGLILFAFLIGHMIGNLKAFTGAEHFNEYAHFLRAIGEPIAPHGVLLWIIRLALLFSVAVHVIAAIDLTMRRRRARPQAYGRYKSLAISNASRTMFWGGVTIFAYIVYHILHITVGSLHSDFVPGDAYHNLVAGLQNPIVAIAYILAMIPLGLHLYHGFWAAFNSLGVVNPHLAKGRRGLALALTLLIVLGFAAVPLAVLLGILRIGG